MTILLSLNKFFEIIKLYYYYYILKKLKIFFERKVEDNSTSINYICSLWIFIFFNKKYIYLSM